MFTSLTRLVTFAAVLTVVLGHARVTVPKPRGAGTAHSALCGAAVANKLASDLAGPIENAIKVKDSDYKCNAYLCRGYQFSDNQNNVQTVSAGDSIAFHVDIVAGHRPASANVSIIDTAANKVIAPLKTWPGYPCDSTNPCEDDEDFTITIPNTLGDKCSKAGACAIQWFWYVPKGSQTYESCVDIVTK